MTKCARALIRLMLSGCLATSFAKNGPDVVIRAPQGDFHRSIARLAFGPDGNLFAAYRVRAGAADTAEIHVLTIDPRKGRIEIAHSYPAPRTTLPRIVDDLCLSAHGDLLIYTELHGPVFIAAFKPQTLEMVTSSTMQLFGSGELMPKLSGTTQTAVILSSVRHEPDAGVHLISLSLTDLGKAIEDFTFPFRSGEGQGYAIDASRNAVWLGQGAFWFKHDLKTGNLLGELHARKDISGLIVRDDKLFGLTDKKLAGWMQMFDVSGRELAERNESCGFVRVSLSPDGQFGVAICERTGLDEAQFGKTLRRQAIVFEASTLRVLTSIPMSGDVVKERGPQPGDLWIGVPTPARWHGPDRILLAVPGFPDSISIYSIAVPAK